MRLNPAAFNRFISRNVGQSMLWRQSFACPCTSDASGAANPGCKICRGKGRTWAAPVEGWAGLSQQDSNPQFQEFGAMEQGDAILTVPNDSPFYDMGRFDRVTLLNSTDVFSRVMTRGANDWLADLSIKEITRVFWKNPAGTALIDGGLPTVASDGTLSWASGEPPAGKQYSITGIKYDDYFVWQALPSDRNAHFGEPLPKRVQIRRWDLFGR